MEQQRKNFYITRAYNKFHQDRNPIFSIQELDYDTLDDIITPNGFKEIFSHPYTYDYIPTGQNIFSSVLDRFVRQYVNPNISNEKFLELADSLWCMLEEKYKHSYMTLAESALLYENTVRIFDLNTLNENIIYSTSDSNFYYFDPIIFYDYTFYSFVVYVSPMDSDSTQIVPQNHVTTDSDTLGNLIFGSNDDLFEL
ncbi:18504_t:CDS:1 [Acaulospora morrowiae]|uniref:18504_t:CDS:1 n=1 Tax=Acaulospora morrowiae TaxID=94023 RepID=A0A9N8ZE74_9GLOM|nr:18504_t:CDS:1 [Acaulospora morrowiae]